MYSDGCLRIMNVTVKRLMRQTRSVSRISHGLLSDGTSTHHTSSLHRNECFADSAHLTAVATKIDYDRRPAYASRAV